MCGTAWNNFCRRTNTNKYYIFCKPFDSGFCYCLLLANELLRSNLDHDTEWQQLLFPPLFATSLFLFVDRPLELLAKVLFAFIRLSADSHEKSRSVCFFYNIQSFTFVMSTRCQKILIYHLLGFTNICYNAISISAKTTHPVLLL